MLASLRSDGDLLVCVGTQNSAQAANYPVLGIASVGDETVSDNIGKGSAQIGALTFTKKSDSPAAVGNLATKKDTESTSSCWTLKAPSGALTGSWGSSKLQFFLLQDHIFVSGDIGQTEEHYQQSVSDDVLTFAFVQN
ncbi:hypothetical protein BT69DRAFT_1019102 [Atractiella rhizophila]|nr:hypothetical protein BT69DRAFT_1019102 [Atractiella rhizophila]